MFPTFARKMSVACAAFTALSCSAFAQNINVDGSMGNYYANLYRQTHRRTERLRLWGRGLH